MFALGVLRVVIVVDCIWLFFCCWWLMCFAISFVCSGWLFCLVDLVGGFVCFIMRCFGYFGVLFGCCVLGFRLLSCVGCLVDLVGFLV